MSTTIPATRPLYGLAPDSLSGAMFLFGSLMDRDLLEVVIERPSDHIRQESAVVHGFRRRRAEDEVFPILIPQPDDLGGDSVVDGQLMSGLTNADLDRILFFEGEGYALRPLPILAAAGESVTEAPRRRRTTARAFLSTGLHRDSGEAWRFDHWVANEKPLALMLAEELMAHYGVTPAEQITEGLWNDIKARCHSRLETAARVTPNYAASDQGRWAND